MDELDFKRHLRDLAHGHHHPEEHDWGGTPSNPRAAAKTSGKKSTGKRSKRTRAGKKTAKSSG